MGWGETSCKQVGHPPKEDVVVGGAGSGDKGPVGLSWGH